ncbi:MAG: PD-(D/E)XK nuclease family protein [Succinivibrio sp.]
MSDEIINTAQLQLDKSIAEIRNLQKVQDNTYDPFKKFNLFDILDIKSKEVIMCRFLYELLSPNGSHGMGDTFWRKFIEVIGNNRLIDSNNDVIKVTAENVITDNRRIDILIRTKRQIIPIEVKIYAEEQKNQVKDYLDYCENYTTHNKLDSCILLYLTLDGHYPSKYSTAAEIEQDQDDRIICISFKEHILNFLQQCLSCNCSESVKANIKQYQFAIEEITGRPTMNIQTIEEIAKQINTKEDFLAIQYLNVAQEHRKLHLMKDVFDETASKLFSNNSELKDGIDLIRGYTEEGAKLFQHDTKLTDFYKQKSGIYPCLFWKYGKFKDPNNMNIEYDVAIVLEFDWRPYVGIVLTHQNAKKQFYNLFSESSAKIVKGSYIPENNDAIKNMKNELEKIDVKLSESSTWWIDWARVSAYELFADEKNAPDFKTAFSDDYFQLYDKTTRDKLTDNIVIRFKQYATGLDNLSELNIIQKTNNK